MDKVLFNLINQSGPKFNADVVNGLATVALKDVEAYIDRIFRNAQEGKSGLPPEVKYVGLQRCSIYEEFQENARRMHSNKQTWEIAPSDLYMVKCLFTFNGEPLSPKYLYLPYVHDGGIIRLHGSVFSIAPVLADKAISVSANSIFVALNRGKVTFQRLSKHFYVDGERESPNLVWSLVYNLPERYRNNNASRTVQGGKTTMAHYLFARQGVTATFAERAGVKVIIGDKDEITAECYDPKEWAICSSIYEGTMIKPREFKGVNYVPPRLRLAIRRQDLNPTTIGLIGAFFYISELFPQRVKPVPEYVDNPRLWVILLGKLLFGDHVADGKLIDDVQNHLRSLEGYVDEDIQLRLAEEGIYVNDMFDLFFEMIESFMPMITAQTSASMYDKRLKILEYVLRDIMNDIHTFMYSLNSFKKRKLTRADVEDALKKKIKTERIRKINGHGELASVSSPGDNKYFKITSRLVPQSHSSGPMAKSKQATNVNDPSGYLDASIAEAGCYCTMSNPDLTGRSKINPCITTTPKGDIVQNPKLKPLLDRVQKRIAR